MVFIPLQLIIRCKPACKMKFLNRSAFKTGTSIDSLNPTFFYGSVDPRARAFAIAPATHRKPRG